MSRLQKTVNRSKLRWLSADIYPELLILRSGVPSEKGERVIYGLKFPDGLKKNQKLEEPVITPTTHPLVGAKGHDERLTREQIIEKISQ